MIVGPLLPAFLGRAVPVLKVALSGQGVLCAGDVLTVLRRQAGHRRDPWQVPAEPDASTRHGSFAGWLSRLMSANPECRAGLVVVLDGLDELPHDSEVPALFPPAAELPARCYLVLATRPAVKAAVARGLERIRSTPGHTAELEMRGNSPEHRAVLEAYLGKQGLEEVADPLIERAGGSFLYAFHYTRALRHRVFERLADLPPPGEYYPRFFEHLRDRVGDDSFERTYAVLLALLAVAREPISLAHLTAWGLESWRASAALGDLADLLHVRREPEDPESLYSLGHEAIREFLTTDPDWQARLRTSDRQLAELTLSRFGNHWPAADLFDPVEGYMILHLLEHAGASGLGATVRSDTALADAVSVQASLLHERLWDDRAALAAATCIAIRQHQVEALGRPEDRLKLANAHGNFALALSSLGRMPDALNQHQACIALLRALTPEERGDDREPALAEALTGYGVTLANAGREAEASASLDEAVALCRPPDGESRGLQVRAALARACLNRSTLRSNPERRRDCDEAVALLTTLVELEGQSNLRPSLARALLSRAGHALVVGDRAAAIADFEAAVARFTSLVDDGSHPELAADLATASYDLGIALHEEGLFDAAVSAFTRAIACWKPLVEWQGRRGLLGESARAYLGRATSLDALGQAENTLGDFREATDRLRQVLVDDPDPPLRLQTDLGRALALMAGMLLRLGHRHDARAVALEAVSVLRKACERLPTRTGDTQTEAELILRFAERVLQNASRVPVLDWILRAFDRWLPNA